MPRDPAWPPLATGAARPAPGSLLGALRLRRHAIATAAIATGDLAAVTIGAIVAGAQWWTIASLPTWPLLLAAYGLYAERQPGLRGARGEAGAVAHAVLAGCVAVAAAADISGTSFGLGRLVILGATVTAVLLVVRAAMRRALVAALGPELMVLVGADERLDRLVQRLAGRRDVEAAGRLPTADGGLARLLDERAVDRVVIAGTALEARAFSELLASLRGRQVRLSAFAAQADVLSDADGSREGALVTLHTGPPSRAWRALKRATDIVGAGAALAAVSPLVVLVALAIRLESSGPALFPQRRVGRGGRTFVMWKLRTMVIDAEELREGLVASSRDPNWLAVDDDPRITRVGRLLRRSSLDELPQLWNVLRGDMSLVGPRPLIEVEAQHAPAWARERSGVAPGITGLWQIAGRAAIPFEEMLRLDGLYVMTWSLRRDMVILARTVPAVLSAKGAN